MTKRGGFGSVQKSINLLKVLKLLISSDWPLTFYKISGIVTVQERSFLLLESR